MNSIRIALVLAAVVSAMFFMACGGGGFDKTPAAEPELDPDTLCNKMANCAEDVVAAMVACDNWVQEEKVDVCVKQWELYAKCLQNHAGCDEPQNTPECAQLTSAYTSCKSKPEALSSCVHTCSSETGACEQECMTACLASLEACIADPKSAGYSFETSCFSFGSTACPG